MRLSGEDKDAKIVELYKGGWSFRQLQKRYHRSPNYIARLVKGIEVKCTFCGKPKGKIRFHAHHPDRINQPDYTIPLCPSCHATEEARLRREKQSQSRTPAVNTHQLINRESSPTTALLTYPSRPLSNTERKLITAAGITLLVLELFPNLLGDIQRHWQHYNKSDRRPIMGLNRPH